MELPGSHTFDTQHPVQVLESQTSLAGGVQDANRRPSTTAHSESVFMEAEFRLITSTMLSQKCPAHAMG